MENKFDIGSYIIDSNYRMLYINEAAKEMYPSVQVGEICHKALALSDKPCETCPIGQNTSLFYNSIRKEWISAQAAGMCLPAYGQCYNIQFQLKQRSNSAPVLHRQEDAQMQAVVEQIGSTKGNECIVGTYCEPSLPMFYANDRTIQMLGFDSLEELLQATGGLAMNLVHPDDVDKVIQNAAGNFVPGKSYETVHRVHKKDGSWLWIVNKGQVMETPEGKMALVSVCMDLSSIFARQNNLRTQYEELLRKDSVFDFYMNNMPGGYHRCGSGEGFPLSYISDSFLSVVGWDRDRLEQELGNKYLNLVAPEDRQMFLSLEPELIRNGRINCAYRILRMDGGRRWIQDSTMYVEKDGEKYFQCAIMDITDLVEGMNDRQQKLEEAMARVEAVSKAKSAFLFNVSHDIRTPMNAIKGFAHMIEKNFNDAQMVGDTIHKIQQATDTLMSLMNDVLDLARIEQGKEEINSEVVDLYENGKNLYEMFRGEMESAGIHFAGAGDQNLERVYCDNLKLTRVMMNMLSNAKKFTPAGGNVTFGVYRLHKDETCGTYRFYVKDNGIGMSPEFQARAFEQFERERTSTESRVSGSGLGLSIIKKLVDLMGGTVTIDSELGKGTEISVVLTFPLVREIDQDRQQTEDRTVNIQGKRILLVEDNDFNREIARFVLENMGLKVEEANDGSVAVDMVCRAEPGYYDLVLMDLQMPVMDGYAATREIRTLADVRRASVPIIAMTANAFKEDKEKCLEVGMNGHLGKPIEPKMLEQTLAEYL